MQPSARVRTAACLLLVSLLLSARTGAASDPEISADSGVSLSAVLDPVWTCLGGAVSAVTHSVTSWLDARLRGVEARLGEQLGAVQTRLETTRTEMTTALERVEKALAATESRPCQPPTTLRDCSDLPAGSPSGVYLLQPGLRQPVPAYCDQDTDGGGWTVFQRRADIEPRQDFFVGWQEYKYGFGRLDGEFWWGLKRLWVAMSLLDRQYELRVDMEDFDGEKRHAAYHVFRIAPEVDGYRLSVSNYTGTAGDSLSGHSGQRFSTRDRDHDTDSGSCATTYTGAWWYTGCHNSNLNGRYLAGEHASYADGVNWQAWKGYHYSLKTVTMKIRPTYKL